MNKIIYLNDLKLKTFTEQDALDYCQLNSINPDSIISLTLHNNLLTDISGIKLFKNLEILWLYNNLIKDIKVLKYLNNLRILDIRELKLKSNQIKYIKNLKRLEILYNYNGFKDMSVLNQLNKNIRIN